MRQSLLCGMEVIHRLHPDIRERSRQGFFFGKVSAKCCKKILLVMCVNLEATSAILLSVPVIQWTED